MSTLVASIIRPEEANAMARRRYQHPPVKQTGTRDKSARRWYFVARVDVLTGPNEVGRPQRRIYLEGCETKRQAEQKRDEILATTVNRPAETISSQVLFGTVMDKFISLAMVRPQTLRHYEHIIGKHLRPAWGKSRMCDITPLAVETWLIGMARQYRESTVGAARRIFGTIWKAALRWQMTREACPTTLCPRIKATTAPRKKDLPTVQQWQDILAILHEPYRSIALIAAKTGMRIGEVLALTWEKFSEDNPMIEESAQQDGRIGPVKTEKGRRPVLMAHLHGSVQRPAGAKGRMFTVQYNAVQVALRNAGESVGIKYQGFGCHTLRRMFITMFRRETDDISLAMGQVGHSSRHTSDLYLIAGEPEVQARAEVVRRVSSRLETIQ